MRGQLKREGERYGGGPIGVKAWWPYQPLVLKVEVERGTPRAWNGVSFPNVHPWKREGMLETDWLT